MNSITQDARYRYSIMQYAEKYGVARASRKYNKSRSYIYFWKKRYDGSMESLLCQSRRPHSHPREHTQQELNLIRDMRRRNPKLGIVELWARMRARGYTGCVESLWRVMRREGLIATKKEKAKKYNILMVPGRSFACPGYVRLAYCVSYEKIVKALPEFAKLAKEYVQAL